MSSFLNGRPVDFLNFTEICRTLGLEWQEVAELATIENEATVTSLPNLSNPLPNQLYQLELPEGQLEIASPFYVNRPPIEERCYEEIRKPGSLIRIKAPRQMGKTSLMARIIHESQNQGHYAVTLDFQLAAQQIFVNSDKFLRWFCVSIAVALNIPHQLENYWDLAAILGSSMACKAYFEEYLLQKIDKPLTIALDEVDKVFLNIQKYTVIFLDYYELYTKKVSEEIFGKNCV